VEVVFAPFGRGGWKAGVGGYRKEASTPSTEKLLEFLVRLEVVTSVAIDVGVCNDDKEKQIVVA
jgi:hypothetical protein